MRRFVSRIFYAFAVVALPLLSASEKPETPHLEFVTEYIHELASTEDVRASAEKELAQAKDANERLSDSIHTSTLIQLELQSQIGMLKTMKLNEPFDPLIPNISRFYAAKVALHQRIIDIGTAFLAGPNPGVDFGKLAAEMPTIRAKLDYIDKALFEVSSTVFATLIDLKPDPKNHVSHLIITKAEKAQTDRRSQQRLRREIKSEGSELYCGCRRRFKGVSSQGL